MKQEKKVSRIDPIKIVLGGEGGTGKTTLLKTKNTGNFDYSSDITIGIDFGCLNVRWRNENIPLLIYDLGGQKRFQFLHDSYITGTKAGIILYDLTRKKTFDAIGNWLNLFYHEDPEIPLFIIGSKHDLVEEEILYQYHSYWKKVYPKLSKYNVISHSFISSKSAFGIDEIFLKILRNIKKIPYFPPLAPEIAN
jgi:small GTP-binding protein